MPRANPGALEGHARLFLSDTSYSGVPFRVGKNDDLFLFKKESHTLFRKFEMEMHCLGAPASAK